MRAPRLKQPLFSKEHGEAYNKALNDRLVCRIVMAYDCIWNLLHEPRDVPLPDRLNNAEANLQNLGGMIENVLGDAVFDVCPEQLAFEEQILDPSNKPFMLNKGAVK
jgi:hypothetical protein